MNRLLILSILGASLSSCASTPTPNPWDDIVVPAEGATVPLDCGEFPLPNDLSEDDITYSADGVRALEAYRVCSETNQQIGAAHAEQVDDLRRGTAALVDAGKHQRAIAEMRREMLEEERRHALWERVQYWVVILAMAAAL
jgi:hypothetical protein